MNVELISFHRVPLAGIHTLRHDPELGCRIKDDIAILTIDGQDKCGLAAALTDLPGVTCVPSRSSEWTIPFKGQSTYDLLKELYKAAAGAVVANVHLQTKPNLSVEGAVDGWTILKLGGAEHPRFDGLVGRLQAAGCEAEAITGRDELPAV